ncbi:TetR/AcrR family transcriptional regulator [Halobacillus massiliensis]|uniref:TetR/AcrR family transcriptional regulator n=1 Tax=Halobacillus massiliensis TaxID=1926286 RepID=UPI0009E24F48|nr:TetR/AcrR family transcriptional regulator [Halobacillus massiliensis]
MKNNLSSRQKKALNTRKSLQESAVKLFKEKGYENTSVEDITLEAGTSKGSFYTYYKSKDEVIVDHYRKIDEEYEKLFSENSPERSNEERLLNVLHAGFSFSEKLGQEFLAIVLLNKLTTNPKDSEKLYSIVNDIIEQGKIKGEFRFYGPTEDFTEMTLTFYQGLLLDYCLIKNPEIKLSSYAGEKMRTFIRKMLSS